MKRPSTRDWSRLKLLKFSAISVILLFLLAEGVARILLAIKYREAHTSVYIQGSPLQDDDSASVFNNQPFYAEYQKTFQFNECGMKCAYGDFAMPVKRPGELWVLLLGGSAMEGMGSNKDGKWFDITNAPDDPFDQTIGAYLEDSLRARLSSRPVRVFNAAVCGFTLSQGLLRYQALARRYDFDWVISMDGVNECDTLATGSEGEQRAYDHAYWASLPLHSAPLKYIIPVTRHSALVNALKQSWYYLRLQGRMARNAKKGFPERRYWAAQNARVAAAQNAAAPAAQNANLAETPVYDPRVLASRNAYLRLVHTWEDRLQQSGKQYLFLVQPYLIFRDTARLTVEERALRQYFLATDYDPHKVAFLQAVNDSVENETDPHFQTMEGVNEWEGWTLVDYCHFTPAANQRIAGGLARYILSGGNAFSCRTRKGT